MRPSTLSFALDAAYGSGACRRTISIIASSGHVEGHLSDDFHEMRCWIRHDGRAVTAVEGETIRFPTSVCPAAVGVLQEVVGMPLDTTVRDFYRDGRARHHCTHLFDLAVLVVRHGGLALGTTFYEAIVPDESETPVIASISRNDVIVHRWQVRSGMILNPQHLRQNTLDKGFASWAAKVFDDNDLEAATILARTWLIAIGRRFLIEQAAGQKISKNTEMIGRCFAYAPSRVAEAVFTVNQGVKRI